MQIPIIQISAAALCTSFLYSLILLIFSVFKKNKTMMSAPFISLSAAVTVLQMVGFLEWFEIPLCLRQLLLVLDYLVTYLVSLMFYWYVSTYVYALRNPAKSTRPADEVRIFQWGAVLGAAALVLFCSSWRNGWLYCLSVSGELNPTMFYPVVILPGGVWAVLSGTLLICNWKRMPFAQFLSLLCFLIVPAFLFLVDAAANLSLGIFISSVTFFMIYTRVDNAQGEVLLKQKEALMKKEAEMNQVKMELMMSQIQPHFLYNALSSIAYLCTEDPEEAERATTEFANYLRGNLQSIGAKVPIPFEVELSHVEQYLRIEKRRFDERLNVVYDIQERNFKIPALTLQTLVENAVRYSVSAKYEPTTVRILSKAADREYLVQIIDDGPGFDPNTKASDDRRHIGLAGSRYRLEEMMGGFMEIDSVIGCGTTVTIHIPKEAEA